MRRKTALLLALICLAVCGQSPANAYVENSFHAPYEGSESLTIPNITKKQAIEIATDHISKQHPDKINQVDVSNALIVYSKSYPFGYNITFPRVINGIEYSHDGISLFVDGKLGGITACTISFDENVVPEALNQPITKHRAREKFISAMGLKLTYSKKITDNKITPYLTYTADEIIINAQTGNIIPTPYYIPGDGYFDVVNTAEKVSEYVDDKASIEIGYADGIARSVGELSVTDDYKIKSVDYLKNLDGTPLITLHYEKGINTKDVTLNAQTGEIIEYVDNSADAPTTPADIEAFAQKYYGEYDHNFQKRKSTSQNGATILYERLVDGIPYKSNGLYITQVGGKIKSIAFAWDNVEFPKATDIISIEGAYEEFFKKTDLVLSYHKRDNGILTPVYRASAKGTGIIDAISGRQLNYDGSFYHSVNEITYLDINTHYAAPYATALADCDIYVSSGNVFLEDFITQQEFLLLISEFIKGTKPVLNTTGILTDDQREMLYAYMYTNGVMNPSETDYNGFVTRQDAIRYFMCILGQGVTGAMNDIYIPHFADSHQITHLGYVELARSLGIIRGSTDGYFHPDEFLTKGDSLIIVYNYLLTQK